MRFELVIELLTAILEIAAEDRQRSPSSSLGEIELSDLLPPWM